MGFGTYNEYFDRRAVGEEKKKKKKVEKGEKEEEGEKKMKDVKYS